MTERYDIATAEHYAAYRPPLHRLILEKTLDRSESFRSALDVGCGTGYSSFALTPYSDRICRIDNSEEMLNLAEKHPKISYKFGDVDSLSDLTDQPFDIVTFAGSLVYTKSPKLREALQKICSPSATVIVYDFDLILKDLIDLINVSVPPDVSGYDHDIGISEWQEFEKVSIVSESIEIDLEADQAAHLLLSDSFRYDLIRNRLGDQNLFEKLVDLLKNHDKNLRIEAKIWRKRYRFSPRN